MKLKHTPGKWIVRKTVDESGDYPFPTYDILAIMEWGPQCVACAFQHAPNAKLIAAAPDMLELMIATYKEEQYMIEVEGYTGTSDFIWNHKNKKAIIERATGMAISEVIESENKIPNRNGEGYQG